MFDGEQMHAGWAVVVRGERIDMAGPLASIAGSIRALAAGEKDTSIPATDVNNEIGDIARAAEVFRRTLVDADAAREAAVRALAEQRLAEASYRKLFETSVDGIYVTTPAGALVNANPALARMMGYDTPQELIDSIGDIERTLALEPRHFGALSGLGQICLRHGERAGALIAFDAALRVHPHLPGLREAAEKLRSSFSRTLH